MGLIMILSEITVLLVVFMLSAVSCFEIQRVTYGYEIDSFRGNIYNSEDSFTNQQRYDEDCTKRNSSCLTINCKNGACCRCKCNEGLTFLSYHHGCLGPDDIRRNSGICVYILVYEILLRLRFIFRSIDQSAQAINRRNFSGIICIVILLF